MSFLSWLFKKISSLKCDGIDIDDYRHADELIV